MRSTLKYAIACTAALLSTAQAGTWMPAWAARHGLHQADFEKVSNDFKNKSYTPKYIDAFTVNGEVRFGGMWSQPSVQTETGIHLTAEQHNAKFIPLTQKTVPLGPRYLRGYTDATGEARFSSIWDQYAPGSSAIAINSTQLEGMVKSGPCGTRVDSISGYEVDGEARYTATWNDINVCRRASFNLTADEFLEQHANNTAPDLGFPIVSLDAYTLNGKVYFAGVWRGPPSIEEQVLRINMTGTEYQTEFNKQAARNFRPVIFSGYAVENSARYAAVWEKVQPIWF